MLQVRADPEEAEGEYQWMAVLTWAGERPTDDIIDEISKKIENYRAKILMFDEWQPRLGYTSGIHPSGDGRLLKDRRASVFLSRKRICFRGQDEKRQSSLRHESERQGATGMEELS